MASPLAASLRVKNTVLLLHDPASLPVEARRPDLEAELVALGFRVVAAAWQDDVVRAVPSQTMPFVDALTEEGLVAEQVDTGEANVWCHLRAATVTLVDEAGVTSANVETSMVGTFVTLRTLLEDGAIVRTLRSVDARREGVVADAARSLRNLRSPLAVALALPWYPRARVRPFLDAPRIGLWDLDLPEATAIADVVATHRRRVADHGGGVSPCDMADPANRRRVDRRLQATSREKETFVTGRSTLGLLAVAFVGSFVCTALLPGLEGTASSVCLAPLPTVGGLWILGSFPHWAMAVFVVMAIAGVAVHPIPVVAGAVAGLAVLFAHAAVLTALGLQSLGRPWLLRGLTEPRKVPADLLPADEA